MTLTNEQQILHKCIFRNKNPSVLDLSFNESDLLGCLNEYNIDERYLSNIDVLFDIDTFEPADTVDDEEPVTTYQLKSEPLIDMWVSWVRDESIFEEFDVSKISSTRYDARGRFNGSDISFVIFFDSYELERYNLNPEGLEFGFGFLNSNQLRNEEHVFSWYKPFEDGFEKEFRNHIHKYQQSIAAGFVDPENVSGYEISVEDSVRNYLKSQDYSIRREVADAVPIASNYGINTGDSDFAAIKDESDEQIILCKCNKKKKWHIHRFEQETVVSAEKSKHLEHLLDKIELKISTYDKILTYEETIKSLSTVLSVASTILATFVLAQNLEPARQFFSDTFGISLPELSFGWLLISLIIILPILLFVLSPYIWKIFLFKWEISSPTDN